MSSSVYVPPRFRGDVQEGLRIIDENSFALVISLDAQGAPYTSHIPLIRRQKGDGEWVLLGHVAKANPQWKHFARGSSATVVFNGAHSYISPTWYVSGRDVPTWNYVACHVVGRVRLIEDFESLRELLVELSDYFERDRARPWQFELPSDLEDPTALSSAIVGFEISPESIDVKLKLSQNRSQADKQAVVAHLKAEADPLALAVARLMEGQGT